ncbi:MAG: ATP-binding protein [Anaerolineae bacterium]|nr:ATP-binding protein [Anaerolineae bacterium]
MSQPTVIRLELPAEHRFLNVAAACIEALLERVNDVADRGMVSYGLQLAVQETCANIVDHAYRDQQGGRICLEFALRTDPRRLEIDVYDAGRPFDPSRVREPDLEHAQERGYGLFLMRKLLDAVTYERRDECNHWHLVKNL